MFFHKVKVTQMNHHVLEPYWMVPYDLVHILSSSNIKRKVDIRHVGGKYQWMIFLISFCYNTVEASPKMLEQFDQICLTCEAKPKENTIEMLLKVPRRTLLKHFKSWEALFWDQKIHFLNFTGWLYFFLFWSFCRNAACSSNGTHQNLFLNSHHMIIANWVGSSLNFYLHIKIICPGNSENMLTFILWQKW